MALGVERRCEQPSPSRPSTLVQRKEPVGQRGCLTRHCPRPLQGQGEQLESGWAATSSPNQCRASFPEPLSSAFALPPIDGWAGEEPCGPGRIHALSGFPREWLSKSLILMKTGQSGRRLQRLEGGGAGLWLHRTFRGGDPSPLHCCFLTGNSPGDP